MNLALSLWRKNSSILMQYKQNEREIDYESSIYLEVIVNSLCNI